MDQNQLKIIVSKSLEGENFVSFQIDHTGSSGVTDGYMGDIKFVKIVGTKTDGKDTTVDLVIKRGKTDESFTENVRTFMDMYFNQEITSYSKIFPLLKTFQLEKHIENYFDAVPKCYRCFEQELIIVLENLRTLGYTVHDRRVALNRKHLELVLNEFGRFHALSFALRDQKPTEFTNLLQTIRRTDLKMFDTELYYSMFTTTFNSLPKILKDRNQPELLHQLNKFLQRDYIDDIRKLLKEETSYKVISHVDSWTNNFMFLYERNDPVKVKIIDWQVMNVRNSPVYDIAHFLYTCSTPEDLDQLEDLLKIYHSSFSKYLTQLGSDPEKLFSFRTLKEHWRKFSAVAIVYVPYVIKQSFWNEEDAPSVEDENVDDWSATAAQIVIKDENYYKRLLGVLKHFFDYKLID